MSPALWLLLLVVGCTLHANRSPSLADARPDGFNAYKDALRGRNDDSEEAGDEMSDAQQTALLSKIIRFYRTPLHMTDDGTTPPNSPNLPPPHPGDVLAQFRKRTVSKFKSAFLYYLTHDLAHLQNILLFDGWLAAQRAAQRELAALRARSSVVVAVGDEPVRSAYIPRAQI